MRRNFGLDSNRNLRSSEVEQQMVGSSAKTQCKGLLPQAVQGLGCSLLAARDEAVQDPKHRLAVVPVMNPMFPSHIPDERTEP